MFQKPGMNNLMKSKRTICHDLWKCELVVGGFRHLHLPLTLFGPKPWLGQNSSNWIFPRPTTLSTPKQSSTLIVEVVRSIKFSLHRIPYRPPITACWINSGGLIDIYIGKRWYLHLVTAFTETIGIFFTCTPLPITIISIIERIGSCEDVFNLHPA